MTFTNWLFVAGLIAVSWAVGYIMFTRESRLLGQLAEALGGENMSSVLGGNYVKLDHEGAELQIRLMPGSANNNTRSQLLILRKSPPEFRMQISPRSWTSRLGSAMGIVKDVTVGDITIDERYRVQASDEDKAIRFLTDPQRRQALDYFFDHGFTDIRLAEDDVCVMKPQDLKNDLDSGLVNRHLEQFANLFPVDSKA